MAENVFDCIYENGEYVLRFDDEPVDRFDLLIRAKLRLKYALTIPLTPGSEHPIDVYNRVFKIEDKMQIVANRKAKQEIRNKRLNVRAERKRNGTVQKRNPIGF